MFSSRALHVVTFIALALFTTVLQGQTPPPPAGTVSKPRISDITKSSLKVEGTDTVASGWTVIDAHVTIVPKAGGTNEGGKISWSNSNGSGSLGTPTGQPGYYVPYWVNNLQYGTEYNVQLFVRYAKGTKYQPGYTEEEVGSSEETAKTLPP